MSTNPASLTIRSITIAAFVLGAISFLSAAEPAQTGNQGSVSKKAAVQEEQPLTEMQKMARQYRAQGLEFQNAGDLDTAMNLYQKAIQLDPLYAVTYNDLGVVYEAKGFLDRAQQCYAKSIQTDPNYLSAYSNMAMFYENQRDLKNAAYYWDKRAQLGSPDDVWTQKARQRLSDIRLVLSDKPFEEAQEQDIIGLMQDVAGKKASLRKDNKALAASYYKKAKMNFRKGDDVTALKLAIDASQLDPANKDYQAFIKKLETRLLSK